MYRKCLDIKHLPLLSYQSEIGTAFKTSILKITGSGDSVDYDKMFILLVYDFIFTVQMFTKCCFDVYIQTQFSPVGVLPP